MFEIEVDVRDEHCFNTLAALNKCTTAEYAAGDQIRMVKKIKNMNFFKLLIRYCKLVRLRVTFVKL